MYYHIHIVKMETQSTLKVQLNFFDLKTPQMYYHIRYCQNGNPMHSQSSTFFGLKTPQMCDIVTLLRTWDLRVSHGPICAMIWKLSYSYHLYVLVVYKSKYILDAKWYQKVAQSSLPYNFEQLSYSIIYILRKTWDWEHGSCMVALSIEDVWRSSCLTSKLRLTLLRIIKLNCQGYI